ncbi:hypothetical protein OPT61_g5348 [Boeremia exigua]|uniref:Uncharacterized protein n=1 Tax=Boeremia exigua TaxID=749465 RepID=A0ACC2IAR6_9PLEO|nr:hypothetical protein OPT61_g5348 [Boeremia exigua]
MAPSINLQEQEPQLKATYLHGWRLAIVISSLCFGTLLVAIDTTIIAVAVPSISTDFQAFNDIQWYGSAYLLTVTAFQPAFGALFRYFSAKQVYLASVLIFEIGSVLCAAAPNSSVFIAGRAVSGVGAAGLYQGALAIVGLTVELAKRPMFLGIVLSVFGIAVCFGPPLGGVFTDHASWRWCFWINLPIGAVALCLLSVFLRIEQSRGDVSLPFKTKLKKLDLLGIGTIVGAVTCLMLSLQWGQEHGNWRHGRVVGCFAAALILTLGFGVIQWRKQDLATVPLRILRQRSIFMGAFYLFFLEMAIYVCLFYIPFFYQSVQLNTATISGLKEIPLGLAQVISIVVVGALVTRFGHYVPFMVLGPLIAIIGTVFLAHINVNTQYILVAVFLVISGIGFGTGLQMPFTAVQAVLADDDIPVGNAIMVFFSQLGASIAISVAQSVFSSSLKGDITRKLSSVTDARFADFDPAAVIAAGPKGMKALAHDAVVLRFLQDSYAVAVRHTLYVAVATVIVAIPFALGMQWLNVKAISKAKSESTEMLVERNRGDEEKGSA